MLPRLSLVFRDLLYQDSAFTALLPPARLVVDRAPPDVASLFGKVQVLTTAPIDGDIVAYRPHVQFDAYAPVSDSSEDTVWAVVCEAMRVFRHARRVVYGDVVYSGNRITEGPQSFPDTTRGEANPLSRALVRAEFRCRVR